MGLTIVATLWIAPCWSDSCIAEQGIPIQEMDAYACETVADGIVDHATQTGQLTHAWCALHTNPQQEIAE